MTTFLVAVDPGTTQAGVAVFDQVNCLLRVRLIAPPKKYALPVRMTLAVQEAAQMASELGVVRFRGVVEQPRKYPGSPEDPNDLIKLGEIGGLILGTFRPQEVMNPTPTDWKPSIPKDKFAPRILQELSADERRRGGELLDNHNVVDAVGIGLWALGRL